LTGAVERWDNRLACIAFPRQKLQVYCSTNRNRRFHVCAGRMMPRKAIAGHNAAEPGFKREEANSSDDRKLLRTLNVISFHFASGIQMAGHQDARYIPPRRERDRSPRRWRNRFAVWLVLATVVMVVVAWLAFRAMFV
jgi:hypothetical protein